MGTDIIAPIRQVRSNGRNNTEVKHAFLYAEVNSARAVQRPHFIIFALDPPLLPPNHPCLASAVTSPRAAIVTPLGLLLAESGIERF